MVRNHRRGVVLVLLIERRGCNILEGLLIDLRLVKYVALSGASRILRAGRSTATNISRATFRIGSFRVHVKNVHHNRSFNLFVLIFI